MLGAIARKIGKHHRAKQTPHGRQTVRQLMGHGAATNSIEVEAPALFDRVARKWNVDYWNGYLINLYLIFLFLVSQFFVYLYLIALDFPT